MKSAIARGGLPSDLRTAFHQPAVESAPRLDWSVYETDRTGATTVRVCRLDRIRWPGLVVWHERGVYELLSEFNGVALGAQSRPALHGAGFRFKTQRELFAHLATIRVAL